MEPETVKLLKEITGRKLLDTGLRNVFFFLNHIPPKTQVTKPKINEGHTKQTSAQQRQYSNGKTPDGIGWDGRNHFNPEIVSFGTQST